MNSDEFKKNWNKLTPHVEYIEIKCSHCGHDVKSASQAINTFWAKLGRFLCGHGFGNIGIVICENCNKETAPNILLFDSKGEPFHPLTEILGKLSKSPAHNFKMDWKE